MGNCKSKKYVEELPYMEQTVSRRMLVRNIDDYSCTSLDNSQLSFSQMSSSMITKNQVDDDMSLTPHWSLGCSSMVLNGHKCYARDSNNDVVRNHHKNEKFEYSQYQSSVNKEKYNSLPETQFEKNSSTHPLHCAIERGDSETLIFQMLQSDPHSLYIQNKDGKVAVDIAKELRHDNMEKIVKLILNFQSTNKIQEDQKKLINSENNANISEESLKSKFPFADEQKTSSPISSSDETIEIYEPYSDFKNEKKINPDDEIEQNCLYASNQVDVLQAENEKLKAEISELKRVILVLTSSLPSLKADEMGLIHL